jgi:hypothetical protein
MEEKVEAIWGQSKINPDNMAIVLSIEVYGKPYHYRDEFPATRVFLAVDRDEAMGKELARCMRDFSVQLARLKETIHYG